MAENAELQAERRTSSGKETAKRLRRQDMLPAVIYGESKSAVPCTVRRKDLEDLLHDHGRNVILSLAISGEPPENTRIREIQQHPIEGDILHVDFQRISLTEKIVVEVPIHAVGTPAGVRTDGGILENMLHSVEVSCLPTDIPNHIEVDVTPMRIGDTIHVADLKLPEDVSLVTEGDRSVFVVVPPTVVKTPEEEVEEAVPTEEEELQEPEVIERGKRDGEEEEEDR